MRRALTLAALAVSCLLTAAGCGVPDAIERSQALQLAAMRQYRDEVEAYHDKVTAHLAEEKRAQLDAALAASLQQAAGDDGRLTLEAALEKTAKRVALEDAWRAELARLDGEFAQRRAAIGRAIDLAEETLDLAASYGRLATLVRNLFVRDAEARRLLADYETERSPADAGSRSQP
ncbi:MAG: hypothetical protein R6X20_15960 [Phycisphaerae bacterium]